MKTLITLFAKLEASNRFQNRFTDYSTQ